MKVLKERVRGIVQNKLGMIKINRNDRKGALHRAWGYVYSNQLEGDYIEFGVYHGDSLVESYLSYMEAQTWIEGQLKSNEPWRVEMAKYNKQRQVFFHALDTFEGMPENTEGYLAFSKGNFCGNLENVKKACATHGLCEPQLKFYKGIFSATASQLGQNMAQRKASIINFDCDLYQSTKDALEISASLIQTGTVMMMDDYNSFSADNSKGQRKAFHEFCKTSCFQFEAWFAYMYVGQAFLCVGHK